MSRLDRLNELLIRWNPELKEQIASGVWAGGKAPYSLETTKGGRRRLVVIDEESGDRMGFVGDTLDEVLDNFAARLQR